MFRASCGRDITLAYGQRSGGMTCATHEISRTLGRMLSSVVARGYDGMDMKTTQSSANDQAGSPRSRGDVVSNRRPSQKENIDLVTPPTSPYDSL